MAGTILLVISDGFNDMAFLSCQVILEEQGNDIIIASKRKGTSKGIDTSVMTVALNDALNQNENYSAIIVIGGLKLNNWGLLEQTIKSFNNEEKIIGIVGEAVTLLDSIGIVYNYSDKIQKIGTNIFVMSNFDEAEIFAEKLASLI